MDNQILENSGEQNALIRAYLGTSKNADKFYEQIINLGTKNKSQSFRAPLWISFFIGPFYFIYRKMYFVSFLITVIGVALFSIIATMSGSSFSAGFGIIFSAAFWHLYKWDITRKINKIRNENATTLMTTEQLTELASKKGGTANIWLTIVIGIGIIIAASIIGEITVAIVNMLKGA